MREFRPIILLLLLFVGGVLCLPQVAVATTRYVAVTGDGGSNFNAGSTATTPTIAATACTVSGTNIAAASGTPFSGLSGGEYISVYQNGTDTALKAIGVISAVNNGGADVDITAWLLGTPDEDEDRCIVGGAWADPGYAASKLADDDILYIKSGTYTLTTSTPGAAGPVATAANTRIVMEGYYSTPGDGAMNGGTFSPPVIDAGAITGVKLVSVDSNYPNNGQTLYLAVDGQDGTGNDGFYDGSFYGEHRFIKCVATDCRYGFSGGNYAGIIERCYATGCSSFGFYNGLSCIGCVAEANAVGFGNTSIFLYCAAVENTGNGFVLQRYYAPSAIGCIAWGNGGKGFDPLYSMVTLIDCISAANTGVNYDTTGAYDNIIGCAGYASVGANTNHTLAPTAGFITLTADPFTDPDGTPRDFTLNNTAGGGAACKAVGRVLLDHTTYRDIGAVQHADPVASGGETSHVWVR